MQGNTTPSARRSQHGDVSCCTLKLQEAQVSLKLRLTLLQEETVPISVFQTPCGAEAALGEALELRYKFYCRKMALFVTETRMSVLTGEGGGREAALQNPSLVFDWPAVTNQGQRNSVFLFP
jgi:hypothetical protein